MKISYISDIHREFGRFAARPDPDTDVIVFAGDVDLGTAGIDWIVKRQFKCPVIYICGNHEHYGFRYSENLADISKLASNRGIHFLENSFVEIDGIRFLGSTLWTDYDLFKEQKMAMREAGAMLNDYHRIYIDSGKFTAEFALARHRDSVAFLRENITTTSVVVTHHAPTGLSPAYHDDDHGMQPYYKSDLIDLIEETNPLYNEFNINVLCYLIDYANWADYTLKETKTSEGILLTIKRKGKFLGLKFSFL